MINKTFEIQGRQFAKLLRSLEQFIQTVKFQNNFWQQNAFLTCSWRFLIPKRLEKLEFKLEKNIGIENHAGKVKKVVFLFLTLAVTNNEAKASWCKK